MENTLGRIIVFWIFFFAACDALPPFSPAKLKQPPDILVRDNKDCNNRALRDTLPQCDWHYIAYFPRLFRNGVKELVSVSTSGFPKDVNLTVKLLGFRYSDYKEKNGRIVQETKETIPPNQLVSVPVEVPLKIEDDFIRLHILGSATYNDTHEWVFKNKSERISVEKLGLSVLIQTDRPIYKPGQTIRSRVVVVDGKLKPYNGKLDSVLIENPSGSVMRRWTNAPLEEGFASFDLETSVKPVLGGWKIKVEVQSHKEELRVEVKKYVLPKFQVTVTPPPYVTAMMRFTTAEVCAKYSYGKKVLGKMNATVCLERSYGYFHYSRTDEKKEKPACIMFQKKIDGCAIINVELGVLKNMLPKTSSKSPQNPFYELSPIFNLKYHASVTEKATGIQVESDAIDRQIKKRDVELSIKTAQVFKPGFPLSVRIIAKRPDGGAADIDAMLKVTCRGVSEPLIKERLISITNGDREFQLPTVPFSAKDVQIKLRYERRKLYEGEKNWERTSNAEKLLTPWFSPSHSYLNVEPVKKPVRIGDRVVIRVGYTSVDDTPMEREIVYSLMCAGNIVTSKSFRTTFVPARPRPTEPGQEQFTTSKAPSTTVPATRANDSSAVPLPDMWWWRGGTATRPPLPYQFSTSSFEIPIDVRRDMLPSCRLLVYYVRGEEVVADQTFLTIVNEFENDMSIQFASEEVRPGQSIKLLVKGAPKSRIAIAAIDKSVHFLAKGNDIKPEKLEDIRNKLTIGPGYVREWGRCPYGPYNSRRRRSMIWHGSISSDFVDSEKAFANFGAYVLSSLNIDVRPCEPPRPVAVAMEIDRGLPGPAGSSSGGKNSVRPRTEFPETWLWANERLSEVGSKLFEVRVPDTITTWYASGFSISKDAGMGVANPTELRAFQPFFISLSLPYSAIRDEDVTVPAVVFSYLEDSCITIKVSLEFSDEYKMVAGPSAKACLCSSRSATVLFRIKPKKLGHISIQVSAFTMPENVCQSSQPFSNKVSAADVLIRKLLVEAEGVKQEYTRSTFFCPSKEPGKEFTTHLKLKAPRNVVPGSMFTRVQVMGDIMGSSLSNVDNLLAMPHGCGEQNMLNFAPNIFVMNYLNHTNQVDEDIENRALMFMRTGYQRELTYKHRDGSYSAFGSRDKEGSTWLTAFVLKSYAQARPWIDIDEEEIKATTKWLTKSQDSKGCFPQIGQLHNKAMKGGVKTPATLSAYVLISLLEAGAAANSVHILTGSRCVLETFNVVKKFPPAVDSYSLSIMLYLFAKLKYVIEYDEALKYLNDKAVKEDGTTHWQEKKSTKDAGKSWYRARSTDIEQTSYVLLAMLEMEGEKAINKAVPIVRWISKQRNTLGGWSSTQDTVLAMQALSTFARVTYTPGANMIVTVSTNQLEHSFEINPNNKIVLQRVEQVPVPSKLKVYGKGDGCALVQANVKYNVRNVIKKMDFAIDVSIEPVDEPIDTVRKSCRSQKMKVCAWKWKGDESNMAIIDVRMISGFTAGEEQFDKILSMDKQNLKDIEVVDKSVVFYVRKIGRKAICVKFRVDQTSTVRGAKAAPVKVYDYYDTGKSTIVMYKFSQTQCHGK